MAPGNPPGEVGEAGPGGGGPGKRKEVKNVSETKCNVLEAWLTEDGKIRIDLECSISASAENAEPVAVEETGTDAEE